MIEQISPQTEIIHGLDFNRNPDRAMKYAVASVITNGVGLLRNALFFSRVEAERVSLLRSRIYGDQNLSYPNIGMQPVIAEALKSITTSMNKFVLSTEGGSLTCTTKEIRNWETTDIALHQDDSFQEHAITGTGGIRGLAKVSGPRSTLRVVKDNTSVSLNNSGTYLEPTEQTRFIEVPYVPGGVILLAEDTFDGMPVAVDSTTVRSEHPAHGGWQETDNSRDVFTMDFELPSGGAFYNLGVAIEDVRLHHQQSNRYLAVA